MIQALPKRLETIISMVPPSSVIADIGCDHAYTSIALVARGIASSAIRSEKYTRRAIIPENRNPAWRWIDTGFRRRSGYHHHCRYGRSSDAAYPYRPTS